jgi:hypothetical protein
MLWYSVSSIVKLRNMRQEISACRNLVVVSFNTTCIYSLHVDAVWPAVVVAGNTSVSATGHA